MCEEKKKSCGNKCKGKGKCHRAFEKSGKPVPLDILPCTPKKPDTAKKPDTPKG